MKWEYRLFDRYFLSVPNPSKNEIWVTHQTKPLTKMPYAVLVNDIAIPCPYLDACGCDVECMDHNECPKAHRDIQRTSYDSYDDAYEFALSLIFKSGKLHFEKRNDIDIPARIVPAHEIVLKFLDVDGIFRLTDAICVVVVDGQAELV